MHKMWYLVILFIVRYSNCEETDTDEVPEEQTKELLSLIRSKELGTNSTSLYSPIPVTRAPRLPCTCGGGECGCCTGPILASFNQRACMNFTYEPDDFAFTGALSVNGKVLYKNKLSGKNPPPMCIRLPRLRAVQICVRLSNIYFSGANMHTCIDMEANFQDFQVFDTSFDCIKFGVGGLAALPPEEGGGSNSASEEDEDIEDYDDSAR